jgi:hypothetical protein
MDKLQAMKTFVRVVEAGSFSAVAQAAKIGERLMKLAKAGKIAALPTSAAEKAKRAGAI